MTAVEGFQRLPSSIFAAYEGNKEMTATAIILPSKPSSALSIKEHHQSPTPQSIVVIKNDEHFQALKAELNKTSREKIQTKLQIQNKPSSGINITVDTSKARSNTDLLRICLQELGWREYPLGRKGSVCDIYWTSYRFDDYALTFGGKINKYPGSHEVFRKNHLALCLGTMATLYPNEYSFFPKTWLLPKQLDLFNQHMLTEETGSSSKRKKYYIVKPSDGAQGDGIYLIKNSREFYWTNTGREFIVQEYLANPLLLDGYKFDLRIYVVITDIEPLSVYICQEGMARFCTARYEKPSDKNFYKACMHLTNYSLNKKSDNYQHTDDENNGSKRTLSSILKQLEHKGHDTDQIWVKIESLVCKTLFAVSPELSVHYFSELQHRKRQISCFQILGFDILLLDTLEPILLEVNSNPSLRIDYDYEVSPGVVEYLPSRIDENIKRPLLMETLLLVASKSKMKLLKKRREDKSGRRKALSPVPMPPAVYVPSVNTTLHQILPGQLSEALSHLRILNNAVSIFRQCLGTRGAHAVGRSGFRMLARKCQMMSSTAPSTADFDLLFSELIRKFNTMDDNCRCGLSFQGFVESMFRIATKLYPEKDTKLDCFQSMVSGLKLYTPMRITIAPAYGKLSDLRNTYGAGFFDKPTEPALPPAKPPSPVAMTKETRRKQLRKIYSKDPIPKMYIGGKKTMRPTAEQSLKVVNSTVVIGDGTAKLESGDE